MLAALDAPGDPGCQGHHGASRNYYTHFGAEGDIGCAGGHPDGCVTAWAAYWTRLVKAVPYRARKEADLACVAFPRKVRSLTVAVRRCTLAGMT